MANSSTHMPTRDRRPTSREWQLKRKAFIKGKFCEWCGSKINLVIAPKQQPLSYLTHLRKATMTFLQDRVSEGEYVIELKEVRGCPNCGSGSMGHRKTKTPRYRCLKCRFEFDAPVTQEVSTGRLSREDWNRFWAKYSLQIKQEIMKKRSKAYLDYESLQDCIVLCRRCHFARQKNLVLCPICKEKYKHPGNEMGWECFKKTDKGKEVARRFELIHYSHPWCQKTFEIEKQFWDLAADPEVCCLELCAIGASKCDVAQKNWRGEPEERR